MTVSVPDFKMIDIQYFLAPGYNLAKFLRAYGAEDAKSFFPYEYLNSLDQLSSREFPPYTAFWSSLRQVNTLDQDFQKFTNLMQGELGLSETQALRRLGLDEAPRTGVELYNELKEMFVSNSWTMADYLAFYNNLGIYYT